jgi:hypothetical protein
MTTQLLRNFYQRNKNNLPKRIMFYRDGVSEGQFKEVLQAEVRPLTRLMWGWSMCMYDIVDHVMHRRPC